MRAFLRFAPLFRGNLGHLQTHHGQIRAMAIILVPGQYERMLRDLGHTPEPVPDWSPLKFVDTNLTTDEWLMFEFAQRGITPRKANDAIYFAHTWLTAALVVK